LKLTHPVGFDVGLALGSQVVFTQGLRLEQKVGSTLYEQIPVSGSQLLEVHARPSSHNGVTTQDPVELSHVEA